jgi:hypothetical protein
MEEKKILVDVEGAVHLAHEYGERYIGWYFSKKIARHENLPLNYKDTDLSYRFIVSNYNYRFVMPMKIEFVGGLISYSDGDRALGVFRFPRDEKGNFIAPISLKQKNIDDMINMSEEEIKDIFSRKGPLVFDAFKIPQYGFEFLDISDFNIQEIGALTDSLFAQKIKDEFNNHLKSHIEEVQAKITSSPNFLLILQNTLDKKLKDLNEVSLMTGNIIHI